MTKLFLLLSLVHELLSIECLDPIYEEVCDLLRFMGHDNSQFLQWMNLPHNSKLLNSLLWTTVPRYYLTILNRLTLLSPKNLVQDHQTFL